jgi:2-oxoglutarate dehydrogenase E2 component (dihydrolipoamide succinyltransferase)
MAVEVKIPSPGESITEVEIAEWLVESGDYVERDQTIAEIDSDKATLELAAEDAGAIELLVEEGETVEVGAVVAKIDTDAEAPEGSGSDGDDKEEEKADDGDSDKGSDDKKAASSEKSKADEKSADKGSDQKAEENKSAKVTPLAREMMNKNDVSAKQVQGSGSGGKITKNDVESFLSGGISTDAAQGWGGTREKRREKMSSLRRKVAERLVSVKNDTAMLTTFNEVDMKPIMDLRAKYKDKFKEEFGTSLGFMSFFTKAVTEALKAYPAVNGMIDGKEVIYHDYADVGIAVSSPKGLMVPVLRNAEQMALHEIESEIKRLARKARDGKITIDEMTGGTFTITNGGVFGSMLSTPIINPPQSAILGMHNIVDRPIAVDGKVEIRPVMYVALSYDHRIIDGKESVSFLYMIKEMLENPSKLVFSGKDPGEILLGL